MIPLDTIFRKYNKRLLYFAMRYLPQMEAEEVVADVFVKLYRIKPVFETDVKVRAWLYMITANECKDILRQKKMRRKRIKDMPIEEVEQPVEYNIIKAEIAAHLLECVASLPPHCRQVIEYKMEGKLDREIAELMNVAFFTVKAQVRRGYMLLRQRMQPI